MCIIGNVKLSSSRTNQLATAKPSIENVRYGSVRETLSGALCYRIFYIRVYRIDDVSVRRHFRRCYRRRTARA